MELYEKTLEQETLYEGLIVNVRMDAAELPNGKRVRREVVEHPGGVTVAALTPDGELLFVRQFRYPYGEVLLEIPAGKLEKGEDPRDCGIRELKEETGAEAGIFESLGIFYPSPGYSGEKIYMFLARDLVFGEARPDEDEFLDMERISLDRAADMVLSGEIPDGKTMAAVLKVAEMRRRKLI